MPTDDELLPVRDIDICLDPGLPEQSFTLWPDDEITVDERHIFISLKQDVPGRKPESIWIRTQHMRWMSERNAMRALPKADAIEKLIADMRKQGA